MLNSYIMIYLSGNLVPFMNLPLNITQYFPVGWWPFLALSAYVCPAVRGPGLCCSAGTLHSSVTHMQCNYNAPQL